MKNSDGSVKRNTWTYSTKSIKLIDQVESLAPIVGLNAKKMKNGETLVFQTRFFHRINDSRKNDSKAEIISNYDKKVYCVTVDSGALVIKTENGNILICGNCSPFEHQATPMQRDIGLGFDDYEHEHILSDCWEDGVTHVDKYGYKWSANFKGWVQLRQLLENI